MTGPSLCALVTRTHLFLARPAASAAGLASPAGFRWFCADRNSRSVLVRACHAEPLVLGSSGSFTAGFASPAGLRWFCAGRNSRSFLCALVTRNRWFLARPAASLLVSLRRLVSAGSALVATLGPFLCALVTRTRWFLARPAASLLILLRRLVSSDPALLKRFRKALARTSCWSPLVLRLSQSSVFRRLRHWSRAPVSPVHFLMSLLGPRVRIPLEFGCSRPVPHSWLV
jgi:hypothetical protein